MPQYVVRKGDTLWAIAQRVFGNGNRWPELGYKGNPRTMPVGTVLNWGAPAQAAPAQAAPASAPAAQSGSPAQAQKEDEAAILDQETINDNEWRRYLRDYDAVRSYYNIGYGPELNSFIESLVTGKPVTTPDGKIMDIPGLIAEQRKYDENEQAIIDWDRANAQGQTPSTPRPVSTSSNTPYQWINGQLGVGAAKELLMGAEKLRPEWQETEQRHGDQRKQANLSQANTYEGNMDDIYNTWRQAGITGGKAYQAQVGAQRGWAGNVQNRATAEANYQTDTYRNNTAQLQGLAETFRTMDMETWRNQYLPTYNIQDPNMINNAMSMG